MNAITEKHIKESTGVITPPRFATVELILSGTAPLVIERFSKKAELMAKMQEGKSSGSKKIRAARDYDAETEAARYRSEEGWEGMNAAAFRAGMVSACRLVGFKMTLAKLSCFIEADGWDAIDSLPLIHISMQSLRTILFILQLLSKFCRLPNCRGKNNRLIDFSIF
jgi:hypothetical protein